MWLPRIVTILFTCLFLCAFLAGCGMQGKDENSGKDKPELSQPSGTSK
jgi:ABC-type uncharacterized transport system auxiliary subunit